MHRAIIAAIIASSAAAGAADWRFLYAGSGESSATFVDLDSISPREGPSRRVSTYVVERDDAPDGTAAAAIGLEIDCAIRRKRMVSGIRYDERGGILEDLRAPQPWSGNFEAGTQGDLMIAYVCSNGASDPEAESWGGELPFEEMRRQLRARRG